MVAKMKKQKPTSNDATKSSIWGGRFVSGPSQLMQDINASISYDRRLYKQDIAGSKAHATMLAACGIIMHWFPAVSAWGVRPDPGEKAPAPQLREYF